MCAEYSAQIALEAKAMLGMLEQGVLPAVAADLKQFAGGPLAAYEERKAKVRASLCGCESALKCLRPPPPPQVYEALGEKAGSLHDLLDATPDYEEDSQELVRCRQLEKHSA